MAREFPRASRIADQIQRDLSELIRLEFKDPRVGLVTITSAWMSRAICLTRKFTSPRWGTSDAAEQAVAGLQHAAGFLAQPARPHVEGARLPQLQFVYDASVERGIRLSQLIDQAVADSERHADETQIHDEE